MLDDVCIESDQNWNYALMENPGVDSSCKGCLNKNYINCGIYQSKMKQETIDYFG